MWMARAIRVRDHTGSTDTETFSIHINPSRSLVITNQSDTLSPGMAGQFYFCGNLAWTRPATTWRGPCSA
jgi:hypothetical protein